MKKIIAIGFIFVLMLSLCSCTSLDQLRENHARYAEETNDEILYNGDTYYKIEMDGKDYFDFLNGTLYGVVTQYDVPVLLSNHFAVHHIAINPSKTMIMVYYGNNDIYLRSDVYSKYQSISFDQFFSHYYFVGTTGRAKDGIISEDLQSAINAILAGEPNDGIDTSSIYCMGGIDRCDDSGQILLRICNVYSFGKEYVLETMNEDKYYVPVEYREMFERYIGLIE